MSTTIDERVVSMQFDNKHFEKNVQTSMSTIDKLKQSLNFKGSSKGMDELSNSSKNVSDEFKNMENAAYRSGFHLKDVWLKVSSVFEYQVARRIINSASNIAKALTIDPIKTGLKEYETQMGAIQTILANTQSKGTTLDDVNNALDELNEYADKTIYNFTEMTRNIGTFTAAGVELDTAVSAIKGIANLAAVSGSTSQQASTAMYQLSQAMASGTVKLMDWNSVVNAGMGGQVFQDALKETARVHGIAVDDIIKKNGSFRESLSEGWITTEILTETLSKFTGDLNEQQLKSMGYTKEQIDGIIKLGKTANDAATKVKTFTQLYDTLKEAAQSGWAQTWEIIIGDFEEAKSFLTKLSDIFGEIIGNSANARNKLLGDWKTLGGRDDLIQSLMNIIEVIRNLVKPIREAFEDVFPPLTAKKLVEFTKGLKNLTEKLIINSTTADQLSRVFTGLFSIIDILVRLVSGALKGAFEITNALFNAFGYDVLEVTATIGDYIVILRDWIVAHDPLGKVFGKIADAISNGIEEFRNWIETLKESDNLPRDILLGLKNGLIKGIEGVVRVVADLGKRILDAIKNVLGIHSPSVEFYNIGQYIIYGLVNGIKAGFGLIKNLFGELGDFAVKMFDEEVVEKISTLAISGGLVFFAVKAAHAASVIAKPFGVFADLISDVTEIFTQSAKSIYNFSDSFRMMAQGLKWKSVTDGILNVSIAIAILAASVVALTLVDEDRIWGAVGVIGALTGMVALIVGLLAICSKLSGKVAVSFLTFAGLGVMFMMMGSAVKKLADIPEEGLKRALGAITLFSVLIAGIIGIAGSIKQLQQTGILQSGDMNYGQTISAIGLLAKILIAFSATMILMSVAARILGGMDWDAWSRAMIGIGIFTGCIVALMAATKLMSSMSTGMASINGKMVANITQLAGVLMALGGAMILLSIACAIIGNMGWDKLFVGIAGLGILSAFLVGLMAATKLMNNNLTIGKFGATVLAFGGAMLMLSVAIAIVGSMDWDKLVRGTLGLAGLVLFLTGLGAATRLMKKELANVGATLAGFGGAMLMLALALRIIAGMEFGALAKAFIGVLALSGVIAILAACTRAASGQDLKKLGWTVLQFSLALLLVAAGMRLIAGMDIDEMLTAGVVMAGLTGMLALVVKACRGVESAKGTIIALAVTIGILALSVGLLSLVDWQRLIAPTLALVTLLGTLALVVAGIGKVCKAGANLKSSIGVLIVLTVAIGMIAGAIFLVGQLEPERALAAAGAMSLFALAMTGACLIFSKVTMTVKKAIAGALGIAAVGAIIGGVLLLFQDLDATQAIGMAAAIGLFGLTMSAACLIFSKVGTLAWSSLGTAVILIALGGLIGALFYAFQDLDPTQSIGVAGAIGIFALAMSASCLLLSLAKPFATGAIGAVITISVIAGLLGGLLYLLRDLDPAQSLGMVAALSLFAIAMTAACLLLSLAGGVAGPAIVGVLVVGALALAMGLVLLGLKEMKIDEAMPTVIALSTFALAMSAACVLLAAAGLLGVAALAGVLVLSTLTDEILDIVYDMAKDGDVAKVKKGEEVLKALEPCIDALIKVTELMRAVPRTGGLAQLIAGDKLESFVTFVDKLGPLGDGIRKFNDSIGGQKPIDNVAIENAAESIKAVAKIIDVIPKEGGLAGAIEGTRDIEGFIESIIPLGEKIRGFNDALSGEKPLDAAAMTSAITSIKSLAKAFESLPTKGGWDDAFSGDIDVDGFTTKLSTLATGIRGFNDALVGDGKVVLDAIAMTAAITAIKSINKIIESLPRKYDDNLTLFAANAGNFKLLGRGIHNFNEALVGEGKVALDVIAMTAAITAIKSLNNIIEALPRKYDDKITSFAANAGNFKKLGEGIRGFNDALLGKDGDIALNATAMIAAVETVKSLNNVIQALPRKYDDKLFSFASNAGNFKLLGEGIRGFNNALVGEDGAVTINASAMTAAVETLKSLNNVIESLPEDGFSLPEDFVANITSLGEAISAFNKSLGEDGVDAIKVDEGIEAAKSLNKLDKIKIGKISENIGAVVDALSKLGNALGGFCKGLGESFSGEKVIAAIDSIEEIVKVIRKLPSSSKKYKNLTTFADAVKEFGSDMKGVSSNYSASFTELFDALEKLLSVSYDAFSDAADNIADYTEALNDLAEDAKTIWTNIVNDCVSIAENGYQDFFDAGKHVVTGFAAGISENAFVAKARAAAMAAAALSAAEEELDENSPSKEFYRVGRYAALGFTNALGDQEDNSYRAGSQIAGSAKRGLSDAIDKIRAFIDGDMNLQPTIRPVLDMSSVRSNANAINGLFDSNIGVTANVNSIKSMMQGYSQNGANYELLASIDKLRKDLGNVGNTTNYNVNGITYDDGSNIAEAVGTLMRAARIERRV